MYTQHAAHHGILEEQEIDFELFFVTEVLKLRSLHYGYWDNPPEDSSLSLRAIRQAQARYSQLLLEHIPPNTRRILDVGAGVGDNAQTLARAGYQVFAISPDRNHARYFRQMQEPNIRFARCRFEELTIAERFDLILFSESNNYFDPHLGLEQCERFLEPDGQILISGMFRYHDHGPFPQGFDNHDLAYLQIAAEHGFVPDQLIDITDNVLPMVQMLEHVVQRHLRPLVEMLLSYARALSPWKTWLLETLAQREIARLRQAGGYFARRCDSEYFQRHFRYLILRLRRED